MKRLAEKFIAACFAFSGLCWVAARWIDHDIARREAERATHRNFLYLLDEPRVD